jgi:hypothetical protein
MKNLILYGGALVAYLWASKKLKDKESNLSKCLKKVEDEFCSKIDKFTQDNKNSKKEDFDRSKYYDPVYHQNNSSTAAE